jgi:hypothetical protein
MVRGILVGRILNQLLLAEAHNMNISATFADQVVNIVNINDDVAIAWIDASNNLRISRKYISQSDNIIGTSATIIS